MHAITVAAGQQLAFDVDLRDESRLDSYLRLFDADGRQLASNDDSPGPGAEVSRLESYLEYTFPESGTYYLGVSGYRNSNYDPITGGGDGVSSTRPLIGVQMILRFPVELCQCIRREPDQAARASQSKDNGSFLIKDIILISSK